MNVLSGRALPSSGEVRLNGSNLHRMFEAVKQDIAFVPQQDVLHEQLTLRQALDYAAQLRLPRDTSAQQRTKVVEAAAANGWVDGERLMLETLTSIRRAGAQIVLTYYATRAARLIS